MEVERILELLQSQNKDSRKKGEKELEMVTNFNKNKALMTLLEYFLNNGNKLEFRGLAGLIFKNKINNLSREKQFYVPRENFFPKIEENFKEEIKKKLLDNINLSDRLLGRIYSQITAKISILDPLETKKSNPFEFVKILFRYKVQHIDSAFIVLNTVEYIYQEIKEYLHVIKKKRICLDNGLDIIIGMYYSSYCNDAKFKIKIFQTLNTSIEFVLGVFGQKEKKNFLLNVFLNEFYNGEDLIKKQVLEIFEKIFFVFYDQIEDYIRVIFELSIYAVNSYSENLKEGLLEFWSSVAEKEYCLNVSQIQALTEGRWPNSYSKQYIGSLTNFLIPFIIDLLKQDYFDYEREDCTHNLLAANCLNLMSQAAPLKVIPLVIDLLDSSISMNYLPQKNNFWVTSFISIFDGIGSKILYDKALKLTVFWVSEMQNDLNTYYKDLTWGLEKISQTSSIYSRDSVPKLISLILNDLLYGKINQRRFYFLSELFRSFGEEGLLDGFKEEMVVPVLNLIMMYSGETHEFEALSDVICSIFIDLSLRTKLVLLNFLPTIITNRSHIFSSNKKKTNQTLKSEQIGVLKIIASSLHSVGKKTPPNHIRVCIGTLLPIIEERDNNLLISTFEEELVIITGILVQKHKWAFEENIRTLSSFLNSCVRNYHNYETSSIAISVVSDIIRDSGFKVYSYFKELFEFLISMISIEEVHPKIKISSIICLGDFMLSGLISDPCDFQLTIQKIKNLTEEVKINEKSYQIDDLENLLRVKDSLLECITGIVQNHHLIQSRGSSSINFVDFDWILGFLKDCISQPKETSTVYSSVGLIGDMVDFPLSISKGREKIKWIHQMVLEAFFSHDQKLKLLGKWSKTRLRKNGKNLRN